MWAQLLASVRTSNTRMAEPAVPCAVKFAVVQASLWLSQLCLHQILPAPKTATCLHTIELQSACQRMPKLLAAALPREVAVQQAATVACTDRDCCLKQFKPAQTQHCNCCQLSTALLAPLLVLTAATARCMPTKWLVLGVACCIAWLGSLWKEVFEACTAYAKRTMQTM